MSNELEQFFIRNGYLAPKQLADGRFACIMPLIYTGAIIVLNQRELLALMQKRFEELYGVLAKYFD